MSSKFHKSFLKILFTIIVPIIFVIVVFSIYLFDRLLDDKKAFLFEKSAAIASMISNAAVDNLFSTITITQVQNTFQSLNEKELQLEYLVGVIAGDKIEYIAYSGVKPPSVKLEYTTIAVQMRKALLGESGVGIGVDYNNKKVFASYHPIENTKWGLVIKQSYRSHVKILYKTALMSSLAMISLIIFLYIILQKYDKKNRKKIEYSEHRFQQLLESSNDFIWEVDVNYVYKYASEQVENILGYKSKEIVGKKPFDFMSSDEAQKISVKFARIVAQEANIIDLENVNIHKDGHKVYLQTNGSPFFDCDGKLLGYRGVDRDITEITMKQKEIEKLAYYDSLTGLSNRENINTRIEEEISFSVRNSTTSALLFLDLDDFKIINDSYGHCHGDEVLKVVSQRVLGTLRNFDTAGRVGGDEFVILVRGIEKDTQHCLDLVDILVERLILEISKPIYFKDKAHYVGVSIGVALIPHNGITLEEIMKNADTAMYAAKDLGKNQVVFYKLI